MEDLSYFYFFVSFFKSCICKLRRKNASWPARKYLPNVRPHYAVKCCPDKQVWLIAMSGVTCFPFSTFIFYDPFIVILSVWTLVLRWAVILPRIFASFILPKDSLWYCRNCLILFECLSKSSVFGFLPILPCLGLHTVYIHTVSYFPKHSIYGSGIWMKRYPRSWWLVKTLRVLAVWDLDLPSFVVPDIFQIIKQLLEGGCGFDCATMQDWMHGTDTTWSNSSKTWKEINTVLALGVSPQDIVCLVCSSSFQAPDLALQ